MISSTVESNTANVRFCVACHEREADRPNQERPRVFSGLGAMASKRTAASSCLHHIQQPAVTINYFPVELDHRKLRADNKHSGCGQRKAGNVPGFSGCVAGSGSATWHRALQLRRDVLLFRSAPPLLRQRCTSSRPRQFQPEQLDLSIGQTTLAAGVCFAVATIKRGGRS